MPEIYGESEGYRPLERKSGRSRYATMEIVAIVAMPIQTALSFLRLANIIGSIRFMTEKIKTSLWLNILLAALAIGVAYGAWGIGREATVLRREIQAGAAKRDALLAKKAELEARIAEISTPEAIEREAKDTLNLKNKGEQVVVVVPERRGTYATATPATAWDHIRNFFARMFGQGTLPLSAR